MTTYDKLSAIINNENVDNCFFNLYDRWRDESQYEDINEYGKVIFNSISKNFPDYGIQLVSSTKRPFGVKIKLDNKIFHINIKLKGQYACLAVKAC